jgi:2-methylisocitrate lyase-like PEP mutase family enzyme
VAHPADRAAGFLALHHGDVPLLIPNPWDPGSARLLASMGFAALATTSSGFAATLGRLDGSVSLDEALDHAAAIVSSVDVPVSADLENGFADDPTGVAETVRRALATGLAGCSIEDATQRPDDPIYAHDLAVERVAAAVEVAHGTATRMVITARAENHLHGRDDLVDTIRRLQAFGAAGADVLYAPGLIDKAAIAAVVSAVEQPVNVLLLPGGPSVGELADLGVRRMSIGGGLAYAALGAVVAAANELLESGTVGFYRGASVGRAAAKAAFG